MVKSTVDESMIHGAVAPGFEEVQTEFKRNFTNRGELGAACAVYHKGQKIVDYGAVTPTGKHAPFGRKTLWLWCFQRLRVSQQ